MRRTIAILLTLLCLFGFAAQARAEAGHATASCHFTCSTAGAKFDNVLALSNASYVKLDANGWFALDWTQSVSVIWWQWNILPQSYTVSELDANGEVLRESSFSDEQIMRTWRLSEDACGLRVAVEAPSSLCALRAYTAEQAEKADCLFAPVVEKAELMVFVAHPDDELVMLGGLLPLYAGEAGRATTVVYLASEYISRHREALHGLWHVGVRTYPIFLSFMDELPVSREAQLEHFGGMDTVVSRFVAIIRQYRPEVIVTHDVNGEYGHGAHIVTSEAVRLAAEAAADPQQYPDSAALYGVWQVKKLYLHLYPDNPVTLDDTAPLSAFDGKSAMTVAGEAFALHRSQRESWGDLMRARTYDGAKYGLYYTAIGPDTGSNDLFENVDAANATPAPTATPTPAPIPTPTPEPSAVPATKATEDSSEVTSMASVTDAPTASAKAERSNAAVWILCGAALLVIAFLMFLVFRKHRKN